MNWVFLVTFSCFSLVSNYSYGVFDGAGLEFEEIIPRSDYDPASLGTLKGKVEDVIVIPKMTGMGSAVVAVFKTSQGEIYTILGPDWYLKNQSIDVENGQFLTVKGSRIEFRDKVIVIASEVQYNGKDIILRDHQTGKPVWSEWRKGEELFYKNYTW